MLHGRCPIEGDRKEKGPASGGASIMRGGEPQTAAGSSVCTG